MQNLAMQCIAPCPPGTQYGSREPLAVHTHQACNTWQCKSIAPCQQAHSTARERHSAVHVFKTCKTWQCNALHRAHGSREPQCCACIPGTQHLAMQMHCTVPAGTQPLRMHDSKHAKLGNAMHCTVPARHTVRLEGTTGCAYTPGMQHLAMQKHCTVPAGTQHGSREAQCCACIQNMQNLAMQCIAPCPRL